MLVNVPFSIEHEPTRSSISSTPAKLQLTANWISRTIEQLPNQNKMTISISNILYSCCPSLSNKQRKMITNNFDCSSWCLEWNCDFSPLSFSYISRLQIFRCVTSWLKRVCKEDIHLGQSIFLNSCARLFLDLLWGRRKTFSFEFEMIICKCIDRTTEVLWAPTGGGLSNVCSKSMKFETLLWNSEVK